MVPEINGSNSVHEVARYKRGGDCVVEGTGEIEASTSVGIVPRSSRTVCGVLNLVSSSGIAWCG